MIKFRDKALDESAIDIDFVENETPKELIERALATRYPEDKVSEVAPLYCIVVNGVIVEDEGLQAYINIKEEDDILICPRLRGGNFGQIFKQVAIIVIAVVASVVVSPAVGGGFWGAMAASAVTIAATLALNALIPPPGVGGIGAAVTSGAESSQTYNINGQSNTVNRYGRVPRVYGRHRIFPTIAATPYLTIEAEPQTGVLVQYLHAIYDFGYGPLELDTINIGDSSIGQYAEAEYRLVDLNRPAVSEGPWDDVLHDSFQIYKGDYQSDSSSSSLNDDQGPLVPVANYQVERNATPNPELFDQEITLDFTCPRGLIAYGTDGSTGTRTITLEVEFSKVGENIWRKFNDPTYVYGARSAGGTFAAYDHFPYNVAHTGYWVSFLGASNVETVVREGTPANINGGNFTPAIIRRTSFYPAGTNKLGFLAAGAKSIGTLTSNNRAPTIGSPIYFHDGTFLGNVQSYVLKDYTDPDTNATYVDYWYEVTIDRNLTSDIILGIREGYYEDGKYGMIYNSSSVYLTQVLDTFYTRPNTLGRFQIANNNATQAYATLSFKPREAGSYKIRVTRKSSSSSLSFQTVDDLTLYNIGTRFDTDPIVTDKRHVFMEVRIKATNQLSGTIQNLSAVANSVLDYYDTDTSTWKKKVTNNPAWIFTDLLTGEANPRPIDKSRLHIDSILEWAEYCDEIPPPHPDIVYEEKRFECNFILDYETTLNAVLSTVSNAAQASLNIIDGKYGVLLDKKRDVPVQIFTPRNSWGFTSTRSYSEPPHALKVRYIDKTQEWQVREQLVYADGYSLETATEFDELSTFGCTNNEQAWRFGRYMMAQAKLRQEVININVDFEYLVCTRGDFVKFAHDVMKVGGTPARVVNVAGNVIKIDNDIVTEVGESYGYIFRGEDGAISQNSLTVIDSETFSVDGDIPKYGDLIVIGVLEQETIDLIVRAIEPSSDLTALLTLVEKADAVYDAESTGFLPDYNAQLSVTTEGTYAPGPVESLEVVENSWRVVGNNYEYYIGIDWDAPLTGAVDVYEIYVDYGRGYDLVDVTKDSIYEYIVNEDNLNIEHSFKVLAVAADGSKIGLVDAPTVTATPLKKITPPSDVAALYLNVTSEVLQLNWDEVTDPDIRDYLIRYSPNDDATWETSIPLLRTDKNTTLASAQARTGTYLIKALDLNLNESLNAAKAKTAIPELFDLNVIDQTNDFPMLNGVLDKVVKDGDTLILQASNPHPDDPTLNEYFSEGYYYYQEFLDLGDIYTVRLQSNILAEGFTVSDVMSNWITLENVLKLSSSKYSEWDVETQVRYTNAYNVIAEWETLDDVVTMAEGEGENWTEWKSFTQGDFTGRIFQFRLKLISRKPSVTPRVFDGVIKADMPDRIWKANNIVSNVGPTDVYYDPEFKGPAPSPNIQITQDNMQDGDRFVLSDKSLSKFTITFYDKDNNQVSRQFDVAALGYGRKQSEIS